MKRKKILCIAGKNNIAVGVAQYVLEKHDKIELIGCCNSTDNGSNNFQRSFRYFCKQNNILIKNLSELYLIDNLVFLSLEFDKIVKPSNFLSDKLYNLHFSYLPEYKGMYTSALPLLHGKSYTGVTLHKIDTGIDTGDIIDQIKIDLDSEISGQVLYSRYIEEGTKLVIKNLEDILNDNVIAFPQNPHKSTYYSKKTIDYSNLEINLNNTAYQIKSQIRAFTFPAYQLPVLFGYHIYRASITNVRSKKKAGNVVSETNFNLLISTTDYDLILHKDLREELFVSAKEGNIVVLINFINNDYDIYQRSKEGWDIAIIAAYNGQFKYLRYVLEVLKWDVNTVNNNGTTLLMYLMTYTFKSNDTSLLRYFIENHNPIYSLKDYYGHDIEYYAQKQGNLNVLELIKK